MLPSGPSTPMGGGGGAQPVHPSLLRSNSGRLAGQGSPMHSQGAYPSSHMPPRPHYNNVNMLGNVPNAQSLLNQSFGNGVVDPNGQRGGMDTGGAESDPLSGGGMGYNHSPSSFLPTNMVNAVSSSPGHSQQFSDPGGNQMMADQQQSNSHSQQLEHQNFQQPQQQFLRRGGVVPVKLESPVNNNDQYGLQQQQQQQQQLNSLRGLGQVKLEPHQLQSLRNQQHMKMENQHSEQSMIMQQQQLLQMSRQSSQAAAAAQISLLQQHRLLQLQQQQQQQQHQLLKAVPQQRPQIQQHFQGQNMPLRSPVKPVHEAGACARRVNQYMYKQRNRPEDNNIDFWKNFVAEFFAPNSKKKWCVSMYGSGRQTTGVFPQDVWHCEICNRKPGRGFEATFEVLPRLYKIKFESGTLEELLYVDMPREYHNPSGQIVLDYAKAIQESVFEQLRVVRDGQLRIVFSPDLKICSWEFCARRHEELIPRRLLIPQVSQLGAAAQKYQSTTQNASSNASVSDLQSNCNMFLASAKLLAKALEVPSVNDLGYTKRYVRCLQISEVVNSMKDLIDYSRVTGTGPIESLAKFPRRNTSPSFQTQNQPSEDQQQQQQLQQQQQNMLQNSNREQPSTSQATGMQLPTTNGNTASASTPGGAITAVNQNPTVSRPQNPINSANNSPYSTTSLPSPVSAGGTMQPPPFRSPTPPPSNNSPLQQQQQSMNNGDPTDSQSSVQKIIQEMMLNGQMNSPGSGGMSNEMKNVNGNSNGLINGNPGLRFGGMGQAAMLNGVRATMGGGNNPISSMNGRVGIGNQGMSHHQQQDLSNQLNGFGSVNGFNNLQFDWKPSS